MKEFRPYLDKYIQRIDIKPENTKQLFSIGFVGTTGVGKSTTAKEIAKRFGLYVGSNDEIRRFLNDEGIPGLFPKQELLQYIAEEGSKYLYKNKISHVIDADLVKHYELARQNAESFGSKFFLIHLICPEEIIMKHLKNRQSKLAEISNIGGNLNDVGHSLSGKNEYLERTKIHNDVHIPEEVFYMTIDTSLELKPQLDVLEKKLRSDGVIN